MPLQLSRSDASVRVITLPAGAEASVEDGALLYRSGYETLGAAAVVELELRCGSDVSTLTVRLPVEPTLRWGDAVTWPAADGPDAREHPALFIDPAAPDDLWLFGGFSFVPRQFTVVNDLWRFDLRMNRWERVAAMDAPLVAGARVAAGTRAGEFFLSGGDTPSNGPSGEVYRLDVSQRPARFERLATSGAPHTIALHALVHDTQRRRLVSFGGFDGADFSAQVRTLSLEMPQAAWVDVDAGPGPSPRYGFFWGLDAGRLIVFSGGQRASGLSQVNPAGDAWSLDLATLRWTRLATTTMDAPGRRNGCGAVDPSTHRLFVWSGTPDGAFAVDQLSMLPLGSPSPTWARVTTQSPPTARGSCSAVFDAARRRVLFGFGNTASAQFADLQALEVGPAN